MKCVNRWKTSNIEYKKSGIHFNLPRKKERIMDLDMQMSDPTFWDDPDKAKKISQEATLLLSGIILDTQQFTRSTGTRTFSAAMFLRDCGAMPEVVMAMNRTSMDDYQREGRFRQNILLYRGQCAIACAQTDNAAEAGPADRIIAAKAANNLLSVEGIEASFALMKIGDVIHISARSSGSLNVQLILEKIGGGGHYDAAGAQQIDQ